MGHLSFRHRWPRSEPRPLRQRTLRQVREMMMPTASAPSAMLAVRGRGYFNDSDVAEVAKLAANVR